VAGEEDNGNEAVGICKFGLKFQPAQASQAYIVVAEVSSLARDFATARGGSGIKVMLLGTLRILAPCQPA
jgi:hypothetical protein